jgi:hypothetical protein
MRWNWRPPGSCAVQVSRQDDGNNAGVPPIGPGRHVVCFVVRVVADAEDVRVFESAPVFFHVHLRQWALDWLPSGRPSHRHYRWRPRSPRTVHSRRPQRRSQRARRCPPTGTASSAGLGNGIHDTMGASPDEWLFSRANGDTATSAANTAGAGSADPSACRSRHADRRCRDRGAGRG